MKINIKNNLIKHKGIFFVIILGSVAYILCATKSGLWFDEAVEYYYSKVMIGEVPGGFGTRNMMERILRTYQPPLYNVLMYFWLRVFDTEFTFRLAGIIITMVGAIASYLAINEYISDERWATAGALFYVFTPGVVHYGLECAEYNLVICLLSWTVYFYFRVLRRKDTKSLVGFFVCSVLSVYSQYGAAFLVIGLYVSIAIDVFFEKNKLLLKKLLGFSVVTFFFAVLPLLFIFLLPQMNNQGSTTVSHMPCFRYGFFIDFVLGAWRTLHGIYTRWIVGICILVVICIIALFVQTKFMIKPVIAITITWLLYFLTVSCSYYGYNNWNPTSVGTQNIGGRYSLFLIPIISTTLFIGLKVTSQGIFERDAKYHKVFIIACTVGLCLFCVRGIYFVGADVSIKDDVREATAAWYSAKAYNSKTLVHARDDTVFHFYLTHDKRFDSSFNRNIAIAEKWTNSDEEMQELLDQMGYLDSDDFYYMVPSRKEYDYFVKVVSDQGYQRKIIYDGQTVLLHVTK